VVPPDAVGRYLADVAAMVAARPDACRYLVDVSRCAVHRLTTSELEAIAPDVVAGFRVPERSVDTRRVADAFVDALHADARIDVVTDRRITAVEPARDDHTSWFVRTGDERYGPFDAVVNALWHGRPAVDESVGHRPDIEQQHRYRVSVFARTRQAVETPCAVLSVGPFGDVKNYDGRTFYLSWYPLGLLAGAESVAPPAVAELTDDARRQLARAVVDALRSYLPWVDRIDAAALDARVEGGWVYSQGRGSLADPRATVHQRSRLGITNLGTYYSVDTGKYSVAPTLAEQLVRAMTDEA
jgi:hypothetical protein